ncbi:MAG: hypothetical protein AUJ52_15585 [Elusimicrobia bacterium CG1_02_63_36]|nr:MAG: hypothetical protein AUJ52_15585 [Elusimicrobia bacterium CG1_02_63_36]
MSVLKKIPLFAGLSRRELGRVSDIIHEREYERGEAVFLMDQPGAAFFIVMEGELDIIVPQDGADPLKLATIGEGLSVGELALLDASPRSASAVASKKTRALAFFREDLHKLLESEPFIGSKIYRTLSTIIGARLRATNAQLQKLTEKNGNAKNL